jgi:hypothetical protein|nr:MAG TPA: hypothetical protein [Caudoviricetes sp.]
MKLTAKEFHKPKTEWKVTKKFNYRKLYWLITNFIFLVVVPIVVSIAVFGLAFITISLTLGGK